MQYQWVYTQSSKVNTNVVLSAWRPSLLSSHFIMAPLVASLIFHNISCKEKLGDWLFVFHQKFGHWYRNPEFPWRAGSEPAPPRVRGLNMDSLLVGKTQVSTHCINLRTMCSCLHCWCSSFRYGQLSGMVEPIAGLLGAVAVVLAEPLLPYALAFAAGAMVYVVVDDIIPEAQAR